MLEQLCASTKSKLLVGMNMDIKTIPKQNTFVTIRVKSKAFSHRIGGVLKTKTFPKLHVYEDDGTQ